MMLIAAGFVAVFLSSYLVSARVGARRQSVALGLVAGVVSYLVLFGVYLVALALVARAKLVAFMTTELPLLIERVMGLLDRVTLIRDTI